MLEFLPTLAFPRPRKKNGRKLVCADTDTAAAAAAAAAGASRKENWKNKHMPTESNRPAVQIDIFIINKSEKKN